MTPKIPKYQLHKRSGQAKVRLNGKDFYLGKHGTDESKQEYDRLIDRWLQNGRSIGVAQPKPVPIVSDEITVMELCLKYLRHCEEYYPVEGGRQTGSLDRAKQMIKRIRKVGGSLFVTDFGPRKLQEFQKALENERPRLTRKYANDLTDTARDMFRWGASQEFLPGSHWHNLKAVRNLRMGKTKAKESTPVMPVDDATVDATLKELGSIVGAMVRLQRLTGARPGEVCAMRPCDIDRSGDVWLFVPAKHKTQHFGKKRTIAIGPRGQAVLLPYLDRNPESYCFSPMESEQLRWLDLRRDRKTKVQPSQRGNARRKKKPKHMPGDRYKTGSYSYAVRRASIRAGVEPWTPNRLRHSAATKIEGEFTLEDAQAVLGHSTPNMTRRYSDAQRRAAEKVMKEIG